MIAAAFIFINLLLFTACGANDLYRDFLDEQDEFFADSWDNRDNEESLDDGVGLQRREAASARRNETGENDLSSRLVSNSSDSVSPSAIDGEAAMRETLNQILEELEAIKATKMCSDSQPDGMDCDVVGAWNAAEIGLRVELSVISENSLQVKLAEVANKKPAHRMDSKWKCSGHIIHRNGGPLYFYCTNHPLQSMTIFHGICKRCSGFDTIFGEWVFQHVPKDCRQLLTFSETQRDVFYKDIVHHASKNSTVNLNISNNASSAGASKSSKVRRNSKRANEKLMHKWSRDLL